jgi:hypothetical protein
MSTPLQTLLIQAQVLLQEGDAENALQRQVIELIGAALDRCNVLAAIGRDVNATAAEPIHIAVDGEIGATDLARRLARCGLALKHGERGQLVLVHGNGDADVARDKTRQLLFEAHGVIESARLALSSRLEGDVEMSVGSALEVAARLVDNAAAQLASD